MPAALLPICNATSPQQLSIGLWPPDLLQMGVATRVSSHGLLTGGSLAKATERHSYHLHVPYILKPLKPAARARLAAFAKAHRKELAVLFKMDVHMIFP